MMKSIMVMLFENYPITLSLTPLLATLLLMEASIISPMVKKIIPNVNYSELMWKFVPVMVVLIIYVVFLTSVVAMEGSKELGSGDFGEGTSTMQAMKDSLPAVSPSEEMPNLLDKWKSMQDKTSMQSFIMSQMKIKESYQQIILVTGKEMTEIPMVVETEGKAEIDIFLISLKTNKEDKEAQIISFNTFLEWLTKTRKVNVPMQILKNKNGDFYLYMASVQGSVDNWCMSYSSVYMKAIMEMKMSDLNTVMTNKMYAFKTNFHPAMDIYYIKEETMEFMKMDPTFKEKMDYNIKILVSKLMPKQFIEISNSLAAKKMKYK